MDKKHESLSPWWLSALIILAVLVGLIAAYPRPDAQTRKLAAQKPSELSIAYLEAWLRLQPDSPTYLALLASQYVGTGRWQDALMVAERLEALEENRGRAQVLKVGISEQLAYQQPPGDPERRAALERMLTYMDDALRFDLEPPVLRMFAEKSRDIGADDMRARVYLRLSQADLPNAYEWYGKLGDLQLAREQYQDAAQAYYLAQQAVEPLQAKRHYFLAAIRTLVLGDKVEQACEFAEQHGGELVKDRSSLRYLLRLARQAERSDLALRYARELVAVQDMDSRLPGRRYVNLELSAGPDTGHPVATGAQDDAGPVVSDATAPDDYELIFKAFAESGALDEAQNIAEQALSDQRDPVVWTHRLAQVSQWNGRPEQALKYWLLYAQLSEDSQAWHEILELAPQLQNDEAYMLAWTRSRVDVTQSGTSLSDGRRELLARYMKLAYWDSALGVAQALRSQLSPEEYAPILLSELVITEQLAYQLPANTPERASAVDRYVAALSRTREYAWDVDTLQLIAEKSRAIGAVKLARDYYQDLARTDLPRAAHWHSEVAALSLELQDYTGAASALFSAHGLSDTLNDRRHYFLSALRALEAGNQVEQACEEGQNRLAELETDPETLRYLIHLARQAGRGDLMATYARALIKHSKVSSGPYMDHAMARATTSYAGLGIRAQTVAARVRDFQGYKGRGAPVLRQVAEVELADDYDIAFRAFVESGRLDEAEQVAERALLDDRDTALWSKRLAQVADWNNHGEKALRYWYDHARLTGDSEAWERVLALAPQLNDHQRHLAALIHESDRNPDDLSLKEQVVAAFERLGRPVEAGAWLDNRAHGAVRRPVLEQRAALAQRQGDDARALQTYRQLQLEYGPDVSYATHTATLLYGQGDLAGALQALQQAEDFATRRDNAAPYWRLYAELAALTNDPEARHQAHQQLLQSGEADQADLSRMSWFYDGHPIDAGRIAEVEFRRNGSASALYTALNAYTRARAWPRAQALLDDLDAEQAQMLQSSASLLGARAMYFLAVGKDAAGLRDLRRAVQLPDAGDAVVVAYLWALLDAGSDAELDLALRHWERAARHNASYWGVYGASELRRGNAVRALRYLSKQAAVSQDDLLWRALLADAYEAAGNTELAWSIRLDVWNRLREVHEARSGSGPALGVSALTAPGGRFRTDANYVALSQRFANIDVSRRLLIDWLEQHADGENEMNASRLGTIRGLPALDEQETPARRQRVFAETAKAVTLAWAISGEHNDLARAWLAREYESSLTRPVDLKVALALQSDDRESLRRAVDMDRGHIAPGHRIDALRRLGRVPEAQTVAWRAAEGAPDNNDVHASLSDMLLSQKPGVSLDAKYSRHEPLEYFEGTFTTRYRLTQRFDLGLELTERRQKISERGAGMTWVPRHDRQIGLVLTDTTPQRRLAMTVGHRNALRSFYHFSLEGHFRPEEPLSTVLSAGINQPTTLSPVLQTAAVKDRIQWAAYWRLNKRWFASADAETARYLTQDRQRIGRGHEFGVSGGYSLRTDFPDTNVRLIVRRGIYAARDTVVSAFARLLPDAADLSARSFMPQNTTQYGVLFGLGTDAAAHRRRGWRPFLLGGMVHDRNQGWGPHVHAGVAGSVLGGDQLSLFYRHEAAPRGGGPTLRQFGLSYQFFF